MVFITIDRLCLILEFKGVDEALQFFLYHVRVTIIDVFLPSRKSVVSLLNIYQCYPLCKMVNLKMKLENLSLGKIWHQRPKGDPPCSFYFMLKIEILLIINYI
nr:MAG TPA: hypothetical protein [Caudoviricetes sp.]